MNASDYQESHLINDCQEDVTSRAEQRRVIDQNMQQRAQSSKSNAIYTQTS
jgi:hypothetical protein